MRPILNNIFPFLLFAWSCASCGKKEKELTPLQIQQKADSILQTKIPGILRHAQEDLDKRLSIELKPKVDSLRNASWAPPTLPLLEDWGDKDTADTASDSSTR